MLDLNGIDVTVREWFLVCVGNVGVFFFLMRRITIRTPPRIKPKAAMMTRAVNSWTMVEFDANEDSLLRRKTVFSGEVDIFKAKFGIQKSSGGGRKNTTSIERLIKQTTKVLDNYFVRSRLLSLILDLSQIKSTQRVRQMCCGKSV